MRKFLVQVPDDLDMGDAEEVSICSEDGVVYNSRFFCPVCSLNQREDS